MASRDPPSGHQEMSEIGRLNDSEGSLCLSKERFSKLGIFFFFFRKICFSDRESGVFRVSSLPEDVDGLGLGLLAEG